MLNPAIFHLLGWALVGLAGSMALPALFAAAQSQWFTANTFLVSGLVTVFLGGALVLGFRTRPSAVSRLGSIVLMLLVWIVLPLCGALPFYLGLAELGAVAAVFESTSGLTTTGATVFAEVKTLPEAMILWRAMLQWAGGGLTLLTAFLVLTPSGVSGPPAQTFLPGYERDDLRKSVLATTRAILPTYAGLSAICLIGLWIAGLPSFDALCLAMATLSTGGFVPVDGTIAHYKNPAAELVLVVFMILGAISFVAHRAHLKRMRGGHHETTESHYILMLIVAAVVVLTIIFWSGAGEENRLAWLAALRTALFRAVSLLTTTGFDNAQAAAPPVPFMVALTLTAIGGCAYSTAGGLKVYRLAMLWRQSGRELNRLVHPHGVTSARAAGRLVTISVMKSVWVLLAVYASAAALGGLVLTLDGVDFETALMAAVSSLSNAGPALDMTAGSRALHVYPGLSDVSLLTLGAAMILGRVELLVALSLASAIYWRL